MKIVAKKIFLVLLFIGFYSLNATDIGSDFTIQSHIVFNYGDDNRIANDAVMENGFTLTARTEIISDSVATCSFDSYFPLQGLTSLNGGYLNLNNNVMFNDIFALGSAGKVYGNGYSITFPASGNLVGIPSSIDRGGRLRLLDRELDTGSANSVDWSYDDKYLADVRTTGAVYNVGVYSFDGSDLDFKVGGVPLGNQRSIRWHPSSYYVALASASNVEPVSVYEYIPLTTLTMTFTDYVHGVSGGGAAWSPNGKYLAFSSYTPSLRLYSFSDGSINLIDEYLSPDIGNPYNNSIDWNPEGDKIIIGDTFANLVVYNFDGTSLSVSTSKHIDGATTVSGVSWKKDSSDKDLIAVSLFNSPENIRIYSYLNDTLTEVTSIVNSLNFHSVSWDYNGNRIIGGRVDDTGDDLKVYYFNQNTDNLFLIDSCELGGSGRGERFSSDSRYLACGSTSNYVSVFDFQQNYMLFDNTNLVFNSDAELIVTTTFSGLCTINGNGNKVYLNEDGSLNITSGSQLKLQNLELVNLKQTNLQCLADDASVIFEDCILTITSNYAFNTGSILFKGDVVISGTSKFTYSSSWSSTIDSYSVLKINNGSTFSYAPSVAARDLIYMEDNTSILYLDGCTLHSTTTGLRLTRGKLFIENLVTLDADGSALSESICFGNGMASDDLDINILAHANLDVYGELEYKNTN